MTIHFQIFIYEYFHGGRQEFRENKQQDQYQKHFQS